MFKVLFLLFLIKSTFSANLRRKFVNANETTNSNSNEIIVPVSNINSKIIEDLICPNKEKYKDFLPFHLRLLIDNVTDDNIFKYYIFADYGCPYYENTNNDPRNITFNIPLTTENTSILIGDRKQKSQYLMIYRLKGGDIDHSTIQIYNPNNTLHIRNIFLSFINNKVLYIFPWVDALSNIFVNAYSCSTYTNMYIQKMGITRIAIVFSYLMHTLNVNDIKKYATKQNSGFYPFPQ